MRNRRRKQSKRQTRARAVIVFASLIIIPILIIVLPPQSDANNKRAIKIASSSALAVVMSPQRLKNMKQQMELAQKDKKSEDARKDVELTGFRKQIASSPTGLMLSFFLPIVAIGGFIALLIAHLLKATPSPFWAYVFPRVYVVCLIGYLVWLAHLFTGLPIVVSIEFEFSGVIGVGIGMVLALWYIKKAKERRDALATGQYQICPHCKELIVRLAIVCPNCNKPVAKTEEKK